MHRFYEKAKWIALSGEASGRFSRAYRRWDNLKNKPWDLMERRSGVGHDKSLKV